MPLIVSDEYISEKSGFVSKSNGRYITKFHVNKTRLWGKIIFNRITLSTLRNQIFLLRENLFSKEMRIAAQRTKQTANYC